jgi:transposase InsO family protein
MSWKGVKVSEQRIRFVLRASSGNEEMAGLCREFDISRTTGYLWLKRFAEVERIEDLREKSRRPAHSPQRTSAEIEQRVVAERKLRPDWGARKLRVLLDREGVKKPASTIHRILRRHELVKVHHQHPAALQRFQREQPNQLWQMDFKGLPANLSKGWSPLSVLDDCSRYALELKALDDRKQGKDVRACLIAIFQQEGMPESMLLDHGTPWWSAQHPWGWTQLSIWLMKQGIGLHFAAIRHPQTQGKVERFHRSLEDALHERGFPQQREDWPGWLEAFRQEYNQVRPHEALGMATPASRWHPSQRVYVEKPASWDYPAGSRLACVRASGQIAVAHQDYGISRALAGETVQLQEVSPDRLLVFYRCTCVREINLQKRQSYPVWFSREQRVFED